MKAALLIVLSLSALAFAGPAINTKQTNNQIEANKANQQHMSYDGKQTQAVEILKQWCFSSQMSQPELTASFKKLVSTVETSPEDQSTEAAVMSERICQGAIVQKSAQSGETVAQGGADAQAHELIKDVYMDSLIACQSRECMKQLIKIINSNKVDAIRASYYMTRIAVTEKDSIKEEGEVKQLAESFVNGQYETTNEAIERQKLFAITSLIGKSIEGKAAHQGEQKQKPTGELKQVAEQVVKAIVERYIKPVSEQEVQQYQESAQPSQQIAKKIAKRSAALKALANIPGFVLEECQGVEDTLIRIVVNKNELSTVRQSAIECVEEFSSEQVLKHLKQITFEQEEPIEVRVAAYRALMSAVWAQESKSEQAKQQAAEEIVGQIVRHCEQERNQQQDDQFVLYAISHLDNLRTSQQPEHQAIKECLSKNKQHYMQIQLLCKKFKQQLSNVRKSSRNYKLEQEFNQLESGLVLEGDIIYESKHKQQQQQQTQILPKLIRVNMSMPVMGETVNVVEITIRQDQMDEELLGALKIAKSAKFTTESMGKVVDSFKTSIERTNTNTNTNTYNKQQQQQQAEADLTIKVDGCTIVYLSLDDVKSATTSASTGFGQEHQRNTRSTVSIVDEIIEYLKRKPMSFNRGFNFNLNQQIAKVLDVEANVIAGLRFESRASGQSDRDFEIVAQVEPRFAFEAIVGPAKLTTKKLLQRVSTKTALGLRLRYKSNELVDIQLDLPMNTMELFTVESQMVEKSSSQVNSYSYLPESIYGQEDIYSQDYELEEEQFESRKQQPMLRKMKRSIFFEKEQSTGKQLVKLMQGKRAFAQQVETSEQVARATGLRGKLRVMASPKDMSFILQAVVQKYEPRMQGYRVQLQKVEQRNGDQKQYVFTVSTPNSRPERTMQVRLVKQQTNQRTVIKSDWQSLYAGKQMASTLQLELVHDGRQYAVKAELASGRSHQQPGWRHLFECGLQSGSQAQSGRIATTYKPYLNIESSSLKRPIQMQGLVSYQESAKSVISYELKCPTTGDFVQGKIILEERPVSGVSQSTKRRSMQSPIERLLHSDITLSGELSGQVQEHSVKVHQMIDWSAAKWSLQSDFAAAHKIQQRNSNSNANYKQQQADSQLIAKLKLDQDQQMVVVERKSSQEPRKDFRLTLSSDCSQSSQHQLVAELRYNGQKRASSPLDAQLAYKHKIELTTPKGHNQAAEQWESSYTLELVDSERQISEKLQGRTQVRANRKSKSIESEMSLPSRSQEAKLKVEFVSLKEHQIELVASGRQFQHKSQVRVEPRKVSVQSSSEKRGQMLAKLVLEAATKPEVECQVLVEMPAKRVHFAADLKLSSGKRSSVALQSERFSAKSDFTFDTMSRSSAWRSLTGLRPLEKLHLKGDLKDLVSQEAYWMESQWNGLGADKPQSFLRFDSPLYRQDLEFEPRQQATKFGLFARSKRSAGFQKPVYGEQESLISREKFNYQLEPTSGQQDSYKPLELGNKLWMVRSVFNSPMAVEQLKKQARRALFEYADQRQSQKHQLKWSPSEERLNFAFERQPSGDFGVQPMRLAADLSSPWSYNNNNNNKQQQQRPSTISMNSQFVDFDFNAKPFDGEESFAKLSAVSRHPRSAFNKHESEISYKKNQGYKASMQHQDSKERRHSWQLDADESPKKWAKMSYESEKLGKGQWEHQWRKQPTSSKRSHQRRSSVSGADHDQEQVYANKVHFSGQSPSQQWSHQTSLDWEEPSKMVFGRVRRDLVYADDSQQQQQRRYSAIDYLKHVNARLNSQFNTNANTNDQYKLDFDYQPESHARLNVNMPEDMFHTSSIEFQPSERLYKLQSRLVNQRSSQPQYQFQLATSKPMGLATEQQEPVFVEEAHPMFERPISQRVAANLFKQPLKLDYSDKFGRQARLDYDFVPATAGLKYAGLRQKRAAVFLKDEQADFEHQATYDFYPEQMLAGFKPAQRQPGADFALKTSTKYGPVIVRADSADNTLALQLESPVFTGKLTAETSQSGNQLVKVQVDNKHQTVQLAKIVRKTPMINECAIIHKLAQKIDQARFEHDTELLVSSVSSILKLKSHTVMDQRPVMVVEGELNKQQEKAFVKITGQRVQGQLAVDMINKSANLIFDMDNKRTVSHQTRLVRVSDKFYSLETITTYKQKPIIKVQAKIEAMIFEEPEHVFSGRRSVSQAFEHISTFEATIYEPKLVQITGQFDCNKEEARIVFKDMQAKKLSEIRLHLDQQAKTILVDARSTNSRGIAYKVMKTINVAPLLKAY